MKEIVFLRGSGLVSRGLVNKVCLAVQNLQILKGPLSLAVCTLNQKFTHFKIAVFFIKAAGIKERHILLIRVDTWKQRWWRPWCHWFHILLVFHCLRIDRCLTSYQINALWLVFRSVNQKMDIQSKQEAAELVKGDCGPDLQIMVNWLVSVIWFQWDLFQKRWQNVSIFMQTEHCAYRLQKSEKMFGIGSVFISRMNVKDSK